MFPRRCCFDETDSRQPAHRLCSSLEVSAISSLEHKDLVKSQKSIRRKVLGKKETHKRQSRHSSHSSGNAFTGRKRRPSRMKSADCRLASASARGIHSEQGKRPASHTSRLPSPATWPPHTHSIHHTDVFPPPILPMTAVNRKAF